MIRSRIAWRCACGPVSSTPPRASSIAGWITSSHGTRPYSACSAARPAVAPGTAQDGSPIRKTCVVPVSPPNPTSTACISAPDADARPRPGVATKKSATRGVRPSAGWTSAKPPAPGPVSGLSAAQAAKAAATHASTAFPPSLRMRAPASAVSLWPAATAPFRVPPRSRRSHALFSECSRFHQHFDGRSAYRVGEARTMTPSRVRLAACGVSVTALAVAAAMPSVLGRRLGVAVDALGGASRPWLAAAALGFLLAFSASVGAWRVALAAAGGALGRRQAAARIGVGSLVNAVAPAKLGDAVKLALCTKAADVPDKLWTAGGIYAALAAARTLVLVGLVAVGWSVGAVPAWPLARL